METRAIINVYNGLDSNSIIEALSANTRTFKDITFTKSYSQQPIVIPIVATAYPSNVKASCSTNSLTGATFVLDKDTTTETAIRWIAIGYRNPLS